MGGECGVCHAKGKTDEINLADANQRDLIFKPIFKLMHTSGISALRNAPPPN